MGNFPEAQSSTPVYYANIVSNLILDQLREDIETIVDAQLKQDNHSGTRNQVIKILTSPDPILQDLLQKAATINNWYANSHPQAIPFLTGLGLVQGGAFKFTPNKAHELEYPNHPKTTTGEVEGAVLVACADGLCCINQQNPNETYFMVPNSITSVGEATLDSVTEDGSGHIYEVSRGTKLTINIDGEDFSFTA